MEKRRDNFTMKMTSQIQLTSMVFQSMQERLSSETTTKITILFVLQVCMELLEQVAKEETLSTQSLIRLNQEKK